MLSTKLNFKASRGNQLGITWKISKAARNVVCIYPHLQDAFEREKTQHHRVENGHDGCIFRTKAEDQQNVGRKEGVDGQNCKGDGKNVLDANMVDTG